MSHPDPLYDYEDFDMDHDTNYDDYNDFHEQVVDYYNEVTDDSHYDYYDESMDGDHDSAMESAGWGTDEDYGYFGGEDY